MEQHAINTDASIIVANRRKVRAVIALIMLFVTAIIAFFDPHSIKTIVTFFVAITANVISLATFVVRKKSKSQEQLKNIAVFVTVIWMFMILLHLSW